MIEYILLSSLLISISQYYIYSTNVVWEYMTLLSKILNFNCTKKYFQGILLLEASKNSPNYIMHISTIYNNFFTRLISCPICTGFWLSLLSSIILGNILLFAPIAYLSLCLYFLIKILTNKSI